jgi:glycosyltransferase involved in cell wall biosynthesis
MKILQLATSFQGGAGSAAVRMNSALNMIGEKSTIISRDCILRSDKTEVELLKMSFPKKIQSSTNTLMQSKLMQKNNDLVTPLSVSNLNIQDRILHEADVIHIHAFYNFLNLSSFKRIVELGKPTLFTLHDQRFFTGGCHYSRECTNFERNCSNCPQTRKPFSPVIKNSFSHQKKLLESANNVELVAPSFWLAELSKRSVISGHLTTHVLKNPIPRIYFETPFPSQLKSEEVIRIAFVATNLHNPYKDLTVFVKAVNEFLQVSPRRVCVVLVGHGIIPKFAPWVEIESTHPATDSEMAQLLTTIDLLVVPSNQDNSPSVIGEALATGASVIGSDAGGIPEILEDFGMPIFPVGDANQLGIEMNNWRATVPREVIRKKAQKYFGEETLAQDLVGIYKNLQAKLL